MKKRTVDIRGLFISRYTVLRYIVTSLVTLRTVQHTGNIVSAGRKEKQGTAPVKDRKECRGKSRKAMPGKLTKINLTGGFIHGLPLSNNYAVWAPAYDELLMEKIIVLIR